MSRRKQPQQQPPPTPDNVGGEDAPLERSPTSPVSLLETPPPVGALEPTPIDDSQAAQATTPSVSPFGGTVGAPMRSSLPELDESLESAGASGRSWGASQSQAAPSVFASQGSAFGGRRTSGYPKVSSLEELYAMVPELAEPGSRLRVERTTPEYVSTPDGKVATAGVLGYLTSTPGTEEFSRMFGGRTYNVYAMVDTAPKDNKGGPPMETVRAVAELKFPLDPNLDNLPIIGGPTNSNFAFSPEHYDMGNAYGFFRPSGNQPIIVTSPNQPQQQQAQQQQPPPELFGFMGKVMDRALDNRGQPQAAPGPDPSFITQMTDRQVRILEEQNQKLEARLAEMQDRLEQQNSKPSTEVAVLQSMSGVLSAMKGSSTGEELSGLRAQHEREIERINRLHEDDRRRLVEDHGRALEAMSRDSKLALDRAEQERVRVAEQLRGELEQERRRSADKEKDLRDQHDKDARRASEDAERRVRDERESAEKRERDIKDQHAQAIVNLKESYEARLREQERMFQNQLESTKLHSSTIQETSKATSTMQVQTLQGKVAELTAELSSAKSTIASLQQDSRPKPFLEQLSEVTTTAQAVGFVKPGEAQGGAGDGEQMTTGERAIQALIEQAGPRLPELIQATGIGPAIGSIANRLAGTPPSAGSSGQGQPRHVNVTQVNQDVQQLPAAPQQLVFGDTDGPPVEVPQRQQQVVFVEQPQQRQQQPAQRQPPPRQQQQQQPAAQPQRQAQQQQQAPQQDAPLWAGFEWTNLPDDTLSAVFRTILKGIESDQPNPTEVVADLSRQFGAEMVGAIPAVASVDRVITSIRKAPATARSPLASPQGRAFIRDVWAAMASLAASAQTAQPAQEGTQTT